MKNFLDKKSFGFYLTVATVVLGLLACILYGVSRENKEISVILLLVFAMAFGVLVLVKPFTFTEYLPFVLSAASTGIMFKILLDNLADIFAKNNVIGLSGTFVASLVFVVLAMIVSACSVVFKQEK